MGAVKWIILCGLSLSTVTSWPRENLGDEEDIPICVCPRIYSPVCADNGKTYSNQCDFDCHLNHLRDKGAPEIKVVKEGRCHDEL
ncbi:serine protease inhibitor dipetalogastin-like [Cylas formicarius]|uniref:serine protease inhibitor dipetalogastin-like n=1 Tax=Cylas formicarius TaxID=197179 RepID=UPI00295852FA|nr:serine protease inhibitor dipetalogastin-like [Cylas formicarius]